MEYEFLVDNILQTITLDKKEGQFSVSIGNRSFNADIQRISPTEISLLIGNNSYRVFIAREGEIRHIFLKGAHFVIAEPAQEPSGHHEGELSAQEDSLLVKAPMPGKVIKVNVKENDAVRKNQTLAIVEAMKMENEIKSSIEAVVKKVYVAAGELVDAEKIIIELDLA